MADRGYVRIGELVVLLGVSRTTVWAWRRAGLLPPAQRLGPNTIGWPMEIIDQWRASRPRA
jgi:predicted DNA-binding transcriptional regulator AlpA